MKPDGNTLLIVDYNLTRVDDAARLANYARRQYAAKIVLIRSNPSAIDRELCDAVLDIDPLAEDFIEKSLGQLEAWRSELRAGIVFSDNAVHSGAALLERLGLGVDSSEGARGAFSKYIYRRSEQQHRGLFESQRVMVPECSAIDSFEDLTRFAERHRSAFIIKPSCEGNNRGVVIVRPGDDLRAAFNEVVPYLAGGVICEQLIPYAREYSYDGLGSFAFITEKVSASGRYPVEIAQIQPARLTEIEHAAIERAGRLANLMVGQCDGPFHNEIKVSDDGLFSAVVEPNRRPGGMKIWSLASWVYGVDLYQRWIDSVFDGPLPQLTVTPGRAVAAVTLGVGQDRIFSPDDVDAENTPFVQAMAKTQRILGLRAEELRAMEFNWLSTQRRVVRKLPHDNADFVALACIVLESQQVDIHTVVTLLRQQWLTAIEAWLDRSMRATG